MQEDIKAASILAEKYDKYEVVRKDYRKFELQNFGQNLFKKLPRYFSNNANKLNKYLKIMTTIKRKTTRGHFRKKKIKR